MSLAPTQARLITQTAYKSDLEFALQMVVQKKMSLIWQGQAAAENYPELAAQYQFLEKRLDTEKITIETMLKAATQELEGLEKMRDDNVKSFKYA